jgi:dTDP-4-dehydrorhamnose 3,5-epimerase
MNVIETDLAGVLLIEPDVFHDERGHFLEVFHAERYAEAGIRGPFLQDNASFSTRGVLRGLHFQNPLPQAKLVWVAEGEVLDVAVDIRQGSPGFGKWTAARLSGDNHRQLYIPEGFAHGFCVISATARLVYKCSDIYDPSAETVVLWSDPDLAIDWPIEMPRLSPKDAAAPRLRDIDPARLPRYPGAA